jgi:hypothetical protein
MTLQTARRVRSVTHHIHRPMPNSITIISQLGLRVPWQQQTPNGRLHRLHLCSLQYITTSTSRMATTCPISRIYSVSNSITNHSIHTLILTHTRIPILTSTRILSNIHHHLADNQTGIHGAILTFEYASCHQICSSRPLPVNDEVSRDSISIHE